MYTVGAMQGWQCPVCGKVLAPFVTECPCNGNLQSVTTTSTGTVNATIDGEQLYRSIIESQKKAARRFGKYADAFNKTHPELKRNGD